MFVCEVFPFLFRFEEDANFNYGTSSSSSTLFTTDSIREFLEEIVFEELDRLRPSLSACE